ncbi:hypothetical protein BC830DRAFT_589644 [Chytriomyces sp. MP71]|nr:hypothetical protein BC830DRAFT_589644 [Chytriomyces sp. MP71]
MDPRNLQQRSHIPENTEASHKEACEIETAPISATSSRSGDSLYFQMSVMMAQFNNNVATSSPAHLPPPKVIIVDGRPHLLQMMHPSLSASLPSMAVSSAPFLSLTSKTFESPSLHGAPSNARSIPDSSTTSYSMQVTPSATMLMELFSAPSFLATAVSAQPSVQSGNPTCSPQLLPAQSVATSSQAAPTTAVAQPVAPAAAAAAPGPGQVAPPAGGAAGIAGNLLGLLNNFFQEDPDDEFGDAGALIAAQQAQEAVGGNGDVLAIPRRRHENPLILLSTNLRGGRCCGNILRVSYLGMVEATVAT